MDKEVLEVVLKKSFNDYKIKRIIETKEESVLPKGENYSSTIMKLTLTVVLGNGRLAKRSFISKSERNKQHHHALFNIEVSIYTSILKEMDYLMEEFEDTEGPLWGKFIHYDPADSTIVFEDLKALGFSTVKRTEMQDLDHAKLVLRSLGRYHAMAKVLEVRGIISKDNYQPYMFLHAEGYVRNFIYGGKQALVKAMRKAWGKEWAKYADKLSELDYDELARRFEECSNFDDNTFKCLNHGDCWNNNMMFKHDWEGRPIEMRFLDFQIPHYHSPCVDVIYFMYTSIRSDVRRKHYDSLVELYHTSLTSSLDKFGYAGPKPSLEEIKTVTERLSFFGLNFFIGCSPCVLSSRTDALDIDLIFKTKGEEGINMSVFHEDGIIEKIGEEVKRVVKLLES